MAYQPVEPQTVGGWAGKAGQGAKATVIKTRIAGKIIAENRQHAGCNALLGGGQIGDVEIARLHHDGVWQMFCAGHGVGKFSRRQRIAGNEVEISALRTIHALRQCGNARGDMVNGHHIQRGMGTGR